MEILTENNIAIKKGSDSFDDKSIATIWELIVDLMLLLFSVIRLIIYKSRLPRSLSELPLSASGSLTHIDQGFLMTIPVSTKGSILVGIYLTRL